MRKSTVGIVSFIIVLLLVAFFLYRSVQENKNAELNPSEQVKKTTNGKKPSNTLKSENERRNKNKNEKESGFKGKENVPFHKYKEFYNDYRPVHLQEFHKEVHCDKRGGNFGVSIVEFLFFEKTETGSVKPYEIDSLGYRDLQMRESCGAPGVQLGTQQKGSFRIRVSVIRDCEKCPKTMVPGRKYRIHKFDEIGEVDYRFEMPEEDNFDFVPLGSEKKPDVLRYPILVNDIRKTKQEDEFPPPRKKVTLNIRNALKEKPESKLGDFSKIIVKYDVEQYGFTHEGFSPDGTYKIKINIEKDKTLFPGELKIIGVLSNGYQMLMYKPNVRSRDVDMSKELAYRHEPKRTVKKEIKLNPLFQKNNMDIPDEGLGEVILGNALKQDGSGKERSIRINNVVPYKKNGKWYVQLEAPPGEYVLAIEGTGALDKNFKWSPEKTAEEQKSEGAEEK